MDIYTILMMSGNLLWIPLAIIYLPKLWRFVGRRRDQRRAEARLRRLERPEIMGYFLPKSERPPFTGPEETNGVTQCPTCDPSDASSCSIHGTPPTRRPS
jgi:hypothetical protein